MKIIIKPMGQLSILILLLSILILLLIPGTIAVLRHSHANESAADAGGAVGSAPSSLPTTSDSTGSGDPAGSHASADPGIIYDDNVENGWQAPGWSWAKDVNYDFRDVKYDGTSSIRAHLKQYEGVKLHRADSMDFQKFDRLTFEVRAGSDGVSNLQVQLANDGKKIGTKGMELGPLPPNQWMAVTIPISDFGVTTSTPSDEIWFQSFSKSDVHFYLDDIRLLARGQSGPTGTTVPVSPV
jgi:hypothetical protein